MPPSKVTMTVQAFEVESSFAKINEYCEKTHKQFSQYISQQFEGLLNKGERKWVVSGEQFAELVTKETKKNTCRFRLRVDVNKRVDSYAISTSRQKSVLLSLLMYQVAIQLEHGSKKRLVKKRDERVA